MGTCKLCSKKVGLFQESYYLFDYAFVCGDCKNQCDIVLNSLGSTFDEALAAFKLRYKNAKELMRFVDFFEEKQKEYVEKEENEKNSSSQAKENNSTTGLLVNQNIGPFEGDLVYSIDGVRGRHIDIYVDKCVITTRVTLGSLLTNNATDGEKTFYYSDCIGVQFKTSKFTIGYLQVETAASSGNNHMSNFFNENSFTFDTSVISNERMTEVADYVKQRVDEVKKGHFNRNNGTSTLSVADELIKLKQLMDARVLTQEEFDLQKAKLLNS